MPVRPRAPRGRRPGRSSTGSSSTASSSHETRPDQALPIKPKRSIRIRGVDYPVVLPSWRDPRLHISATFVVLHALGQVEFHFRLSFPQIATAVLTCAAIEVVVTFWQKRVFLWPASILLTGNGIAFIMRIPGTRHGDWWTFHGAWVYVAVGAVAMTSKYLIHFRGRHVFNPANVALVLAYLTLGSGRTEPLQFWWGPLSPALLIALLVIVAGAFLVLSRVGLLAVAVLFWVTFASALGVLALSGHAFSANWHLGPSGGRILWKVLITSPEVFIFLAFMITDPKTAPETVRGRRIYAVAIGLLGALLIAPLQTEFAAKVALLGALTIVCAMRPPHPRRGGNSDAECGRRLIEDDELRVPLDDRDRLSALPESAATGCRSSSRPAPPASRPRIAVFARRGQRPTPAEHTLDDVEVVAEAILVDDLDPETSPVADRRSCRRGKYERDYRHRCRRRTTPTSARSDGAELDVAKLRSGYWRRSFQGR